MIRLAGARSRQRLEQVKIYVWPIVNRSQCVYFELIAFDWFIAVISCTIPCSLSHSHSPVCRLHTHTHTALTDFDFCTQHIIQMFRLSEHCIDFTWIMRTPNTIFVCVLVQPHAWPFEFRWKRKLSICACAPAELSEHKKIAYVCSLVVCLLLVTASRQRFYFCAILSRLHGHNENKKERKKN